MSPGRKFGLPEDREGPLVADSVEKGVLPTLPKILKVAGAVFV